MIRVLFVCYGNICRSPMAEALFNKHVKEARLDNLVEADSAGINNWHAGESPHIGTQKILRELGIHYTHYARQLRKEDIREFQWILAMDQSNLREIRREFGDRPRMHLIMEFAPELGYTDMPDPWYTGDFEETARILTPATERLVAKISQECPPV